MTHHALLTTQVDTGVVVRPIRPAQRRLPGATLLRRMGTHRLGERWLARAHDDGRSLLAYFLPRRLDIDGPLLDAAAQFRHQHALELEVVDSSDRSGATWILTPYPGSHDGLLSLDQLLSLKPDGQMDMYEVSRAMRQLLELVEASNIAGVHHGALQIDQVQLDRHGRLLVELFGVASTVRRTEQAWQPISTSDETRRVIEIGRELVTGTPRGGRSAKIPHSLAPNLERPWRAWFSHGLDPAGGFACAAEALDALPS